MSNIIDTTHNQIAEIDQQIKSNSESTRTQIAEIKENGDLTHIAKNERIYKIERKRDTDYKTLQQKKAKIVNDTRDTLSNRLYSGSKVNDPINFDEAVNRFKNESEKELISRLNQKPSDETKSAIYKGSILSQNPKFNVLATASDLFPADKEKIADYFQFEQEFGELEDRTAKLGRRLFGEQA